MLNSNDVWNELCGDTLHAQNFQSKILIHGSTSSISHTVNRPSEGTKVPFPRGALGTDCVNFVHQLVTSRGGQNDGRLPTILDHF